MKFKIGEKVTEEELYKDPYPIYEKLQREEPISWINCLNMYYAVSYADVEQILKNDTDFLVGQSQSLNHDTFGTHMLTVDGQRQRQYKSTMRSPFQPKFIRAHVEQEIRNHTKELIQSFKAAGNTELRSSFAARLTILTMLSLFGLPRSAEKNLRYWYDSFENALTNFSWDEDVRKKGQKCAAEMHDYFQKYIDHYRKKPDENNLLSNLIEASDKHSLKDEEIKRNVSIIFFGGISTVEALILNAVFALSAHPEVFRRVRSDYSLIPQTVEETVRWVGPVQSATRHVAHDLTFNGVAFKEGDVINCMLAAANRDPRVFENPAEFNIDRPNLKQHFGFAIGPHHCLGANLARAEARIALEELFDQLPDFMMNPDRKTLQEGFEFRQPRSLNLIWDLP